MNHNKLQYAASCFSIVHGFRSLSLKLTCCLQHGIPFDHSDTSFRNLTADGHCDYSTNSLADNIISSGEKAYRKNYWIRQAFNDVENRMPQ